MLFRSYFPGCNPGMSAASVTGSQVNCYGMNYPFVGDIWRPGTTYGAGSDRDPANSVVYGGKVYYPLVAGNVGNQPDISPSYWARSASSGVATAPSSERQSATEVMRAISYDYLTFGSNGAAGAAFMNQNYAYPGDARNVSSGTCSYGYGCYLNGYDLTIMIPGYYIAALVPGIGGSGFDAFNSKWAGQLSGFSEGAVTWAGIASMSSGQAASGVHLQGTVRLAGKVVP